jgi:hypothetical protein
MKGSQDPVSDIGDGAFILDIQMKFTICFDCRFWQEIVLR